MWFITMKTIFEEMIKQQKVDYNKAAALRLSCGEVSYRIQLNYRWRRSRDDQSKLQLRGRLVVAPVPNFRYGSYDPELEKKKTRAVSTSIPWHVNIECLLESFHHKDFCCCSIFAEFLEFLGLFGIISKSIGFSFDFFYSTRSCTILNSISLPVRLFSFSFEIDTTWQ